MKKCKKCKDVWIQGDDRDICFNCLSKKEKEKLLKRFNKKSKKIEKYDESPVDENEENI
jgi:hypothetical protein